MSISAGKVAVVTGAASGLGAATALLLRERGWSVAAISTHPLVVGLLLQLFVANKWKLLPASGYCTVPQPSPSDVQAWRQLAPTGTPAPCGGVGQWAWHLLLPWLTFALFFVNPTTGATFPTADPTGADALFVFSIGNAVPFTSYCPVTAPCVLVTPVVVTVAEPGALALALAALLALGLVHPAARRNPSARGMAA